ESLNIDTLLVNETRGYYLATLRTGVLLPEMTPHLPNPNATLLQTFGTARFVRANLQTLTSDTQIKQTLDQPLRTDLAVTANHPSSIELYILNFPGWAAQVDGQAIPLSTSSSGFITLSVPPINGQIRIRFWDTPIRQLSWIITCISIVVMFLLVRM